MLSNWLLVAHCSRRDDLLVRALPFVEECDVDLDIYALLPLYNYLLIPQFWTYGKTNPGYS